MGARISKRIEWIDVAKGICIVLMVVGHTRLPSIISNWIWSFHMPFFFFISGMTFKVGNYKSLNFFLYRKLRTLLVPFFVFSILVIGISGSYEVNTFKDRFLEVLVHGWGGIALWFVPILFLAELLYYIFYHLLSRNKKFFVVILIVFAYLSYWLSEVHLLLPWAISSVFLAVSFLGLGNKLADFILNVWTDKSVKKTFSFLFISFCIGGLIAQFYHLDMCYNIITSLIPVYIGAILGILFIIQLSMLLTKYMEYTVLKPLFYIFSYWGKNTFFVLAFSQCIQLCLIQGMNSMDISPVLSSVIRHVSMWIILFLITELFNRKLSWILGK